MLYLCNSSLQLSLTSLRSDWHVSRVWPLLVTHGPVWRKQASLVKSDEQELFETGASLLIKFWSRALVSFPRPLRLLVRQAGLVTASQLGSERSVVTTQSVLVSKNEFSRNFL